MYRRYAGSLVALSASCAQCSAFSRKISDCFTLSSLRRNKLRVCFNPQLIPGVPTGISHFQKSMSSRHTDEQPFRNRPTYNFRSSDYPAKKEGPEGPKVSVITSAANDGGAIPTDGRRSGDHRRSRTLRNSSVSTSTVPKRCRRTAPGRCSRPGSGGEVRSALLTPYQT